MSGCCSSLAGEKDMVDIVIQNDGANSCSEDDKQWLESLMHEQKNYASVIQKVPPMFREIEANSNCYDPLVVSIGPYHHGKPKLQPMEQYKFKMACQYADMNQKKLEEYYTQVKEVAKAARESYIDDDGGTIKNISEKDFTRMMFLDGCFILQFIYCYQDSNRKDLMIKDNIAAYVQRDLYLLENQLPFQVLKKLMNLRFDERTWKKSFSNFIEKILGPTHEHSKAHPQDQLIIKFEDNHAHLLDVIRTQLIDTSKDDVNVNETSKNVESPTPSSKHPVTGWSSYRSAKELKAVGIYFRPSKTRKFTDVNFKSIFFVGILTLPLITVDDSTKAMLLNMVAYETSVDGPRDFRVSSYICFIDSLIDHPEDVKELRSKGILANFLGSDQQVADLFNQIADNLVPNQLEYAQVKYKIEKHYKNKIKIWLADWLHTHFSSPWTVLAFVGAVFALVLTVIQTYIAVYPP